MVGAGMTGAVLLNAAEFAKKLGIPASDLVTVGGSLALFNAGELAKKFGIPVFRTDGTGLGLFNTTELGTVRAGGASIAGLLSTAEFAKKFGVLDPVGEVSGANNSLVSGVGAAKDITGGCLALEGCSKKDEAGLGGCPDSFAVVVGLVSENGNEAIGGSFAPVMSC